MNWKISILIIGVTLISCKENSSKNTNLLEEAVTVSENYYSAKYIMEAEELLSLQNRKSDAIKIIDFRKEKNYSEGHIPGAINLWRSDIEDSSFPYGGMMVTKEALETLFSNLGISNQHQLIVYDDRGSCDAIRFWWVLQNYDFDSVKVLNGGIDAWKAINGSISTENTVFVKSNFKLNKTPSNKLYVSKEELFDKISTSSKTILVDTRTKEEYSGKIKKKGAAKAGRIPKSMWIDWTEAVDYTNHKKFKSFANLKRSYKKLNANSTDTIIVYCHSGVRSAHTNFVLSQLLGYKNVKNYDGSWIEWSYYKNLPFEQDSITN